MPKIALNTVAEVLKSESVSPALLRRIIERLHLVAQPADTEERAPAVKKQYAIMISDPDGLLPATDFAGWVIQIPEGESVASVEHRICQAAYEFNATKRGQLLPVRLIGEAIENVPAKLFKEADVWVKTKTPVLMLRTRNAIPGTDNQLELAPKSDEAAAPVEVATTATP